VVAKVVLDSSAVLAFLHGEAGSATVQANLAQAVISTVNVAEVVTRLARAGKGREAVQQVLRILDLDVIDLDGDLAEATGMLVAKTEPAGLSLGDRACLALAAREALPVLTADRAWSKVDAGVEIRLLR
jgi:PIN domain nuclease of toxin-antitoxin system